MRIFYLLLVLIWVSQSSQAAEFPAALLGVGDRLTIDVVGFSDLSGDYAVRDRDVLKLSNGIEISTAGKSVEEFEAAAGKTLAERFGGNPVVVVRSVTWRPVFVYGNVRASAAIPFAPGLTPIKAVVLAGGFKTVPSDDLSTLLANENSNRDLVSAGIALEALLAKEARLIAISQSSARVDFPETLTVSEKDPDITKLLESEKVIFAATRQQAASDKASFLARLKNYQNQLQSLDDNRARLEEANKLAEQELKASEILSKQGLQNLSRLNDAKRDRLMTLAQLSGNQALVFEVRANAEEIRRALEEVDLGNRSQTSLELTQTREAIRQTQEKVRSSRVIANETGGISDSALVPGSEGKGVIFEIVRDGAHLSLAENDFLMPSDVVHVIPTKAPTR
jgi:polysaccharide biosynthesis/export protein ExoF